MAAPIAYPQPMDIPAPLRQLPNQLTVARIVSVPVLCLLIALSTDWHVDFLRWLALLIYVVTIPFAILGARRHRHIV